MGRGTTKKAAEQEAARQALEALGVVPDRIWKASETARSAARPSRGPVRGDRENAAPVHLRSLRIRGFKSFPEPLEITLEPGVAVIVGPNGSGKSNIADAVVWAAGSLTPSELRAEKPDDVLFAGGGDRKPAEHCESSSSSTTRTTRGRISTSARCPSPVVSCAGLRGSTS